MVVPHLQARDSLQTPPCRSDALWQDRCPDDCGAAQLLSAGGALAGCVLSDLSLWCSLRTWLTCLLGHRINDGGGLLLYLFDTL